MGCVAGAWLPAAEEQPVALPPFIVEEPTKGPPWRYAEAPGYEILARCDDAVTRRVVDAHLRLHQLLEEVLPPSLQVTMSVPRVLIVYDDALQPAASQEVIARMLRSSPRVPLPEDLPMPGGRGFRAPASQQRISFLPNLRLWDRDGMAIFMIVRRDDFDADRLALSHDYVSFLVKTRVPALPPWYVHGFLTLYRQMTNGDSRLTLEPMEWISEQHTEALKKDPKTAPPVGPLADFFSYRLGPRDQPNTVDPLKLWQAQAVLFVRWGLEADKGSRRAALRRFVERSAFEGSGEDLFRECFGLGFAEAQAELTKYLPTSVRRSAYFRPEKYRTLAPLPLRNATDGQIARLKGDWERLEIPFVKAISAELAPKYLEQARRTLRRGYERGERDPRLLAVLGLCECDAGDDAAAREYLEAGSRIGPMRPRAQYELARLRLAEFRAQPAGRAGAISVTQTVEVLRPLFAARADQPPLPEVYEMIAETWRVSESKPKRGHLAVIDEGVRLFPRRAELVLRGAELNLLHGYADEAAVLIGIGLRVVEDDAARTRLAALQRQLAGK